MPAFLRLALRSALALPLMGCSEPQPARPERIILVSMDTVRAAQVSGYGAADSTPVLAAIAEEGLLFRHAYGASNYTLPSHMSLMTGRDPKEHAVQALDARLSSQIPTLAELLSSAGYRTRGFHEGGYVAASYGFDRGFEDYSRHDRVSLVRDELRGVLGWMREVQHERYFLFLHTYAAHAPYGGLVRYRREHPERELLGDDRLLRRIQRLDGKKGAKSNDELRQLLLDQSVMNYLREPDEDVHGSVIVGPRFMDTPHFEMDRAQMIRSYEDRIGEVDAAIGRIRELLVELDQWEDTLLIVTADHGEAFFEHNLERHDYVPFEEVLKIPLIISYPRLLRQRETSVVDGYAWHLDVMPTVLSLAGLAVPPACSGLDLTPLFTSDEHIDPGRAIYPAILRTPTRPLAPLRRVVLRDGHKWIEGDALFGDEAGFLFEIAVDLGEHSNLREGKPDLFEAYRADAESYDDALVPVPPEIVTPADEGLEPHEAAEALEELRALGYAD